MYIVHFLGMIKRMYGSLWKQISESLQLYLVNKNNCKLFLCVKKI